MTNDTRDQEVEAKLLESGAILDTLIALIERGPLFDGDVPSKHARDDLIDMGYAVRVVHDGEDGHTAATYQGRDLYKAHFGNAPTLNEAKKMRIANRAVNSAASLKVTTDGGTVCCTNCDDSTKCLSRKGCIWHADINIWE